MRFLLDANISPETAAFLRRQFSFDVLSLLETGQAGLTDFELVNLARKEERIIVTLDLDFGELYHEQSCSAFGVIILRLRDQRIEQVNKVLQKFFQSKLSKELFQKHSHALALLTETAVRIIY
jgi:predicted nuclease of predicted toxin-antitoxin system